MKRFLKIFGVFILVLPLAFVGYVAYRLVPKELNLTLPESLVANSSSDGQALLASAEYMADYPKLLEVWEGQELISYCGVASGVIVLNALGEPVNQISFFNDDTDAVRSRLQVTFGGMSLAELADLLTAHGMDVTKMHGDELTIEELRQVVESNLAREGDYLLANYQRQVLGQGRVGHISPLGAYDSGSDRVLVMDTAGYKYPYTWVQLETLYAAMQEKDPSTDRARGFIEVRLPAAGRL
jgi:hypothetical protein